MRNPLRDSCGSCGRLCDRFSTHDFQNPGDFVRNFDDDCTLLGKYSYYERQSNRCPRTAVCKDMDAFHSSGRHGQQHRFHYFRLCGLHYNRCPFVLLFRYGNRMRGQSDRKQSKYGAFPRRQDRQSHHLRTHDFQRAGSSFGQPYRATVRLW